MAREYLMTWDETNKRWFKWTPEKLRNVVGKKVVKVSCKQLGAPSTKSGSYQAANSWWKEHVVHWELELLRNKEARFPVEAEDAETLEGMATWLRSKSDDEEAERKAEIARRIRRDIESGKKPSYSEREIFALSDWEVRADEDFQARYESDVNVWADRLKQQEPTQPEMTIEAWIDSFVDVLRPKTKPQSLPNIVRQLKEFTAWHGETASIESINESLVRSYYLHLQDNDKSDSTNRDIWSTWKRWVGFLADEGWIERPRNLLSREFTFTVTSVPQAPELAEIKEFLKTLKDERIRLYALLCLNCGLNNADIGQLHNTNYGWKKAQSLLEQGKADCGHIDWRQRRLVRQRQKTKGKGRIPTVCYKLWDETFDLLKSHRSDHERYCLVTNTGNPLWMRNGKRQDAIYDRRWKNLKALTPKQLRAGGATILGDHERFRLYVSQYLADSPRGIPDRHYVVPSQRQFDAAIEWLGKQLKVKSGKA